MVGPGRLELPTLRLSGVRSNHLSYGPARGDPAPAQTAQALDSARFDDPAQDRLTAGSRPAQNKPKARLFGARRDAQTAV